MDASIAITLVAYHLSVVCSHYHHSVCVLSCFSPYKVDVLLSRVIVVYIFSYSVYNICMLNCDTVLLSTVLKWIKLVFLQLDALRHGNS